MNGTIPSQIKTASIIYRILGYIYIVVSIFFFLIFFILGVIFVLQGGENATAGGVFIIIGVIVGLIIALFAFLYFKIAKGIEQKKDWAKVVGIIFAVLMLLSIPIGTILGILIIVNLLSDEATKWFEKSEIPEDQSIISS